MPQGQRCEKGSWAEKQPTRIGTPHQQPATDWHYLPTDPTMDTSEEGRAAMGLSAV